jgi:O-antigen ligase
MTEKPVFKELVTFKDVRSALQVIGKLHANKLLVTIAVILTFPLFFQLSGKIFNDPSLVFDSGGKLNHLPIPISVFAYFGGLILIGDFKKPKISIFLLFITFICMLGITFIPTQSHLSNQKGKFILLLQFILPMFSLIIGQVFETKQLNNKLFEKAVVFVLLIIVPCQLIVTWFSGLSLLSPYLYFFSIYQHLQYVPSIFVCLYLFALFSLWDSAGCYKMILIVLMPLMGAYAVFSSSILTNVVLYSGIFFFAGLLFYRTTNKLVFLLTIVVICTSILSVFIMRKDSDVYKKYLQRVGIPLSNPVVVDNKILNYNDSFLTYRVKIWKHFINKIVSNPEILIFGSPKRPDRSEYPSAHNYYLDLAYNFGILPLLPIIGLLLLTIKAVFGFRKELFSNPDTSGLVFVTLFLVLVDNSLKVGLRQPYPGIITFFLWGLLLSRLSWKKACVQTRP